MESELLLVKMNRIIYEIPTLSTTGTIRISILERNNRLLIDICIHSIF